MKTDANVVHLNKATAEQSPTSPVGRLPVALIQVRDKAAQQLKQSLQSLFDNADDTLFEMADRATSNAEQNAFFEAMRDLRLKRKNIERGFLQKVFESFANLNQYEIGKPQPALDAARVSGIQHFNYSQQALDDVLQQRWTGPRPGCAGLHCQLAPRAWSGARLRAPC